MLKFNSYLKILTISITLYIISLAVIRSDLAFSYRWLAFSIWATSFMFFPLFLIVKNKEIFKNFFKRSFKVNFNKIYFHQLTFILLLSLFFSFILLKNYPFVSVYDQVRDGGLHAHEIANGIIKNIFGYDRYESHGLIVGIITGFFYLFFGNSVFTFRFPAAVFSVLNTLIVYFIIKKNVDKKSAFWGSLVLMTIPINLYFARTEVVVMISTLLTSVILLLFSILLKNKTKENYSLLGLALGFSSSVYASVKAFSIVIAGLVFLITMLDILLHKKLKQNLINLTVLFIFFLIGFGPIILLTTPAIFLQLRELPLHNNAPDSFSLLTIFTNFINNADKLFANYIKSLLVYISEPTMSTHYPDFKPILDRVTGIIFVFGFLISFISKNKFLRIVCLLVFILPFTHSAITDIVNSDQRLTPFFPIIAIITGYGIKTIFSKTQKILKSGIYVLILQIVLVIYILSQGIMFFRNESATKLYSYYDYLTMHVIYDLKSDQSLKEAKNICFYISPGYYNYLSPWHMLNRTQEQFEYFVPDKYFFIFQNNNVRDNQVFISKSCNQNLEEITFTKFTHCSAYTKFLCPKDVKMPFQIYTENSTNKNYQDPNEFLNITPPPLLINPVPAYIP